CFSQSVFLSRYSGLLLLCPFSDCLPGYFVSNLTIQAINNDGLIVAHKNIDPETPVHSLSDKCVFQNINLDSGYSVEFQAYVTRKGKALSATRVLSSISSEEIFAQRAIIDAPKKRSDKPDTVPDSRYIRAFYDRFPFRKSEADVDYIYENAYDHRSGRVSVNLEAYGKIALSRDITVGSFEGGGDIAIMDFGCGAVKYTSEGASLSIRDKTFTWLFKPEWNASIPCKYYFAETVVHLSYILGFYPRGESSKHVLYLTSFLDADMGNSCRKLRQLKIQIGCVAEGTRVLMGDGTQKEIQNVKIGDQILGAEGEQPGTIINVWRGKESKMYCITTEDGSRLFLTGSHYILTDAGMVMASHMHLGMQVRMGSGALQKIRELYTIDEETNVYNLSVQKADGQHGYMICENMVLADNDYSEPVKRKLSRSTLEEDEFLRELDALMKER
ncbi:MAG: hypothetical protein HFF69_13410, partial [Oscillospiraceae bacterium]|nr:hypothetical protein [Oscillospiraceae bacterium]